MPRNNRFRLDQDEYRTPTGVQFRQKNPKEPIAASQLRSWPLPTEDDQLLTQSQVLQD